MVDDERADDPRPGTDPAGGYVAEPAPVLGGPAPGGAGRRRRRLVAALAAVAALGAVAVLALVATGRLAPSPGRPPARIAIVDPDGALAVVDPQGGNRVVHAAEGTTFLFPAWSPDGTRIAAVAQTPDGVALEVFTAEPEGTVVYRSASSAPFYLYWTPDGRSLTFLTSEGASIALRLAPADASTPGTVLRRGAPMYWAWDGAGRLLVHAGGDASAFLGEVASDGTEVATVAGTPGEFRSPAVSADGGYQAYALQTEAGTGEVVTVAGDGSGRHAVPVFGPAAVGFAPSGTQLAFIGAGPGDAPLPLPVGTLRILDAASGDVREILDRQVVAFFWSPDGTTIAAIAVPDQSGPDTALAGSVAGAGGEVGGVRLAAAGDRAGRTRFASAPGIEVALVFVDVAGGSARAERRVQLAPLFTSQVLPYFDQYALSHRIWAPDGSSVLLPVVDDGGSETLQVFPVDGAEPRVLAEGSIGFWSP